MTDVAGAVLAGGRSRRMGRDKRHLDVDGTPLLARAVASLRAVADPVVVVAAPGDEPAVRGAVGDVEVVVDDPAGQGPLAGLATALERCSAEVVTVVAGDHPALQPAVLRSLVHLLASSPGAQAAVLGTDAGPQPLVAAYRPDAAPLVRRLLAGGERRAMAVLDALEVAVLEPQRWRRLDPAGTTAVDLDTPDEVDRFRAARQVEVLRTRGGRTARVADSLVREEPLEVRVAGPGQPPVTVLTTLRTPGYDRDLVLGWLVAEGLLDPAAGPEVEVTTADVREVAVPDDTLTVRLPHPLDLRAAASRHVAATGSCGVCGRAAIEELVGRCAPVPAGVPAGGRLPWSTVASLPDRLRAAQGLFRATGGLHATGIADRDGALHTVREDVGRHNALDAAIGAHVARAALPLHEHLVVLSGRVGFELVAKAAVAGVPVLAAVGAPSDLAVRTAERFGITLVGFLRGGDGNVYTHPDRLDLGA